MHRAPSRIQRVARGRRGPDYCVGRKLILPSSTSLHNMVSQKLMTELHAFPKSQACHDCTIVTMTPIRENGAQCYERTWPICEICDASYRMRFSAVTSFDGLGCGAGRIQSCKGRGTLGGDLGVGWYLSESPDRRRYLEKTLVLPS